MERLTKFWETKDMEGGGDVFEEADPEAALLEQMPLLGHPESEKERLASWLRLRRRARVVIRRLHRDLRHLPMKHSCRCYVLPELHETTSVPPRPFRCQGCDDAKPRPHTQSVSTSTQNVQSRSGSRCVRDRRFNWYAVLNLEFCLYGNHIRSSMDCERIRDPRFAVVTCMFTSFRT